MISDRNIFTTLVELLSGGQAGLRLTLEVPNAKGVLARLSNAIFELDGNIASVGTFPIPEKSDWSGLVLKVEGISRNQLINTLEELGDHVIDVREV
jgi:uncharacterized protein with ACT and thioredoxin-like domain